MVQTVETLLQRASELVVGTYDYLRAVPETAAILGWEKDVDTTHLQERRRFFSIWLSRTLGIDTSTEFANYLFRAGQMHAGHGPRQIHTPPAYVTASIGLVQASFARYLDEAGLPAETIAQAMAGWCKYLSVQLNQMLMGYSVATEYSRGDYNVRCSFFGRLRPAIGQSRLMIPAQSGSRVSDILEKLFNYYPQARRMALDRIWLSEEREDSLWTEVNPAYVPQKGWRVILNGRDLGFDKGFLTPVFEEDEISVFPPGR
jgi:molybdopterin converting factor small subunit